MADSLEGKALGVEARVLEVEELEDSEEGPAFVGTWVWDSKAAVTWRWEGSNVSRRRMILLSS